MHFLFAAWILLAIFSPVSNAKSYSYDYNKFETIADKKKHLTELLNQVKICTEKSFRGDLNVLDVDRIMLNLYGNENHTPVLNFEGYTHEGVMRYSSRYGDWDPIEVNHSFIPCLKSLDAHGDPRLILQLLDLKNFLGFGFMEADAKVFSIPSEKIFKNSVQIINKNLKNKILLENINKIYDGEYSNIDYLKNWANSTLIFAKKGQLVIHDTSVHLPFVVWPEFLQRIQINLAKVLYELIEFHLNVISNNKELRENPEVEKSFKLFTLMSARFIDGVAEINSTLKSHFVDQKRDIKKLGTAVRTFFFRAISFRPMLGDGLLRPRTFCDLFNLINEDRTLSGFMLYQGKDKIEFNAKFLGANDKVIIDDKSFELLMDDQKLEMAFEMRFKELKQAWLKVY